VPQAILLIMATPSCGFYGILLKDTTPCLRRDSNPRPSGWESDVPTIRPRRSRKIQENTLACSWVQRVLVTQQRSSLVMVKCGACSDDFKHLIAVIFSHTKCFSAPYWAMSA
jgi:hypothetical protein